MYWWYKNNIDKYKKYNVLRLFIPKQIYLNQVAKTLPNFERQEFYFTDSYNIINKIITNIEQ